MGSWDNYYNEHPLWAKLTTLRERANNAERSEDWNELDALQYLLNALDNALSRRHKTPALLVPRPLLETTSTVFDAMSVAFDNWQAESADWSDMNAATAAFLQVIAAWPALTSDVAAENVVTATARVNETTAAAIAAVEKQRDELVTNLQTLAEQTEALTEAVGAQKTELDGALVEFGTDSAVKLATAGEEWTTERTKQTEAAQEELEKLRGLEHEARELVHAATSSVVATDYGKYARNKAIAAWICDIAAAVIGAAGVGAILVHLYREGVAVDGNVGLSLTRLAASLGTLGIAALVAHRGHDHHAEGRAAKRTDLALRQVGPFIANLRPAEREQITVELTDRIFIKGELSESTEDGSSSLWDRIQEARAKAKAAEVEA